MAAKETFRKAESLYDLYTRKTKVTADQVSTHYCPGCGHGNVHKMVAEALDDFGLQDRSVFVSPVGCSVFGYYYFHTGNVQAAHGRSPAVATALKRAHPDSIVIGYQGDGDLAGIGGNELLHAANRGEPITIFFINNAIYGMTGGQMAPTTLLGMKTTTTPYGRLARNEGGPIRVVELLSTLSGPVYLERVAITDAKQIMRARTAVRKAIQNQVQNKGFSLVEILSPCPTSWKLSATESRRWIAEEMTKVFPLGATLDRSGEVEPLDPLPRMARPEELAPLLGLDAGDVDPDDRPLSQTGLGFGPNRSGKDQTPRHELTQSPRIKVAGFGGQGVLLLGLGLAECGMEAGYEVSWLPSYGPEMRGGTANCHVRLSAQPIGSPLVAEADVVIAMNRPSLERFLPDVAPGGLLMYDSSLIEERPERHDIQVLPIPATALADELGKSKCANMVLFGAYVERSGVLDPEAVKRGLPRFIKSKDMIEVNRRAIDRGVAFAREALANERVGV